ncbi:PAS domain S-box protein [Kiritimatiella glycovorans]|uniref:histidine kinase n=1 Tax=Kiritimatiella glycovorans TaxID=1307763 RepID=A0A0G3EDR2_9BACT|nr:PAS domain S-box protein [Kiritimatiella glycovorans]AKJ63542.1 multi-sensor hybrid histidine kinase [Kiritimatiella glycovorans]
MKPVVSWIKVIVAVSLLALALTGTAFVHSFRQDLRREVEKDLTAIADLKVFELSLWLKERVSDGGVLMENPFFTAHAERWIRDPDGGGRAELETLFRSLSERYDYSEVLLVDTNLRVRFRLGEWPASNLEAARDTFRLAARERRPEILGMHRGQLVDTPHLSVVAPLFPDHGEDAPPFGAVILICDARDYLYPLIQSWPTPSETAEIVLVRRQGDQVLFLNELRHRENTALNFRLPMSRTNLPATRALQGYSGVMRGKDYRGEDVLSVTRTIPDSPWAMVAKIDTAEAFATMRRETLMVFLLTLGLAAGVVIGGYVVVQRSRKLHYRARYEAERARRRSETRYGTTLRSIGDGVIVTDAEGRIELVNAVAETLTGWTQDEVLGRDLHDIFQIVNEHTRAEVENPVDRVLRENKVAGLANHTVLVARDGTERPIADSGAPICDDAGTVSGVVLVFRDQTEERRAREALEESEQRFRTLFETAPIGIFTTTSVGNVLAANPAMARMLGFHSGRQAVEELRDLGAELYARPERRAEFLHLLKKHGHVENFEYEARGEGGKELWLSMNARISGRREDGPFTIDGFTTDITARRKREMELERLMTAIEHTEESIVVTDADAHYLYMNPAFERVTGYSRDEALGKTPAIHKSGKHDRAFYETLWATITEGRTWQGNFVNQRKDGTQYTEEATISPVLDPRGNIVNYVAVKRDITSEIALENQYRQAQKMESIGRLAGGVAHDYNNKLQSIMGYAELALAEAGDHLELREHLEELRRAAERSADLTRQLLAFARRQTIVPRVISLNDTITGMLKMLRHLIGEDIDLAWQPSEKLWPVNLDPTQIDQILANLCVNARDAIDGVGMVTIETRNVSFNETYCDEHPGFKPGDYVMLGVSDNGCGMSEETREHIFDPFYTTKGVGEGTGLGLATVFGIVKQNNGFINVYSEPEEGTTFRIYLSRHKGDAAEHTPSEDDRQAPRGGETILLVEDDTSVLQFGSTMLAQLGYEVLTAHGGDEALTVLADHNEQVDLMLTDVVMPGMSGKDLAGKVQRLHPGIKVLYMSGYTANAIAHHHVLDEGVRFIPKPFSIQTLAERVRETLDE